MVAAKNKTFQAREDQHIYSHDGALFTIKSLKTFDDIAFESKHLHNNS